jgi:hypothetical protein
MIAHMPAHWNGHVIYDAILCNSKAVKIAFYCPVAVDPAADLESTKTLYFTQTFGILSNTT